jgi:perosamine synthetase
MRLTVPWLDDTEAEAVRAVLSTGYLTQGPVAAQFEQRIADYVGAERAIATSSCTTALHLALAGLGVGPGDEVIVPDFTFPATANVVVQCGAAPVLVDIDPQTFNAPPEAIERAITERTRAIMVVHAFGQCAQMDEIVRIGRQAGIPVIEDAACALGATVGGRQAGALADVACFSFHPRKVITTGEGGMITTNDQALADRMRLLSTHGGRRGEFFIEFDEAGYNYRLSDVNAAIGLAQMDKLDSILEQRRSLAAAYTASLSSVDGVQPPVTAEGCEHTFQSYVVMLDDGIDRDEVIRRMRAAGVETTLGTYALHREPYFTRTLGIDDASLPNAAQAYAQTLTLPLYPGMTSDDVACVVAALSDAVREG